MSPLDILHDLFYNGGPPSLNPLPLLLNMVRHSKNPSRHFQNRCRHRTFYWPVNPVLSPNVIPVVGPCQTTCRQGQMLWKTLFPRLALKSSLGLSARDPTSTRTILQMLIGTCSDMGRLWKLICMYVDSSACGLLVPVDALKLYSLCFWIITSLN